MLENMHSKPGTLLAMCLSVTQPRTVRPRDIVLATSRIVAQFFFMRPDKQMKDAFCYLLAVYAAKYSILVHAGCVQSTHWHAVLGDPYGLIPAFLRNLHRGLANVIKAHRGWSQRFRSLLHPSPGRSECATCVVVDRAVAERSILTALVFESCGELHDRPLLVELEL